MAFWDEWLSSVGGASDLGFPGGPDPFYLSDLGYPGGPDIDFASGLYGLSQEDFQQLLNSINVPQFTPGATSGGTTALDKVLSGLGQGFANLGTGAGGTGFSLMSFGNPPETKNVPKIDIPIPPPVKFAPQPSLLPSFPPSGGGETGGRSLPPTGLEQLLSGLDRGPVDPFAETRSRLNRDLGLQSLMRG